MADVSPHASDAAEHERQLLLRHLEGEQEAFAELVQRYRAPVYSYLVRCNVPTQDRDDLFQEIFIRIHRGAPSYQPQRPLHPWIFTIVANTVRTFLRRRRVRELLYAEPSPELDPPAQNPDSERVVQAQQLVSWLDTEIKRLPAVRRQVLLLAAVERLPLREVAAALSLPLATVKSHLRRARLCLASALAEHHRPEVIT